MKIFSLALLTLVCWAQLACADPMATIPATEAGKHIGEVVTVEDRVASVHHSAKGNTFLNFGASHPNQVFTGWIPAESPAQKSPMLKETEGKTVKITGRVQLYKGKPEIRIDSEEQLRVSR
jgi:DNA/RNA endonuclease YhcR with UshA esterase domain